MADKGIPFDVPTRANLLQGQRLIDEQLREKAARDAKLSPLDKAYAALEAARTFGSGILATVGSLPTRAIKGEDAAQEYINQRMYIPTTEKGMDYVGNVGNFLEQLETKYKLPPVLPEAVALQNVMGPAAKQATKQAAKAAKPVVGQALEDYMFKQGLALPVVKPTGGNWLTGDVEGALNKLKGPTQPRYTHINDQGMAVGEGHGRPMTADEIQQSNADPTFIANQALNKWIDSNLTNYVKKQMATPDDPVRKLAEEGITHLPDTRMPPNMSSVVESRKMAGFPDPVGKSPLAQTWEAWADKPIGFDTVGVMENIGKGEPWMEKADKFARVHGIAPNYVNHMYTDLGFDHIMDVLREDLRAGRIRPEQLNKVSMEQAVRRTHEFDQEQARKMAEAQIKATEGMPVYKDYPEGYKWIELTLPKDLPEGLVDTVSKKHARNAAGELVDDPRYSALESALKYEGDTMGHCVGGYCPDVARGESRIFSLRDAKGEPHVTVEVQPSRNPGWSEVREAGGDPLAVTEEAKRRMGITPENEKDFVKNADSSKRREMQDELNRHFADIYREQFGEPPASIVQIKGKQNRAPKEEYLPFVQDFVRSGQWSDVGDLPNTGLIKNDGKYMTQGEYDDYLLNQLLPPPVEGMKRGGSVRIADNPDTMMMEVEDQKFGIGGMAGKAVKSAVATRELEKAAKITAEIAAKKAAKDALMPQYNEAVKGMTQKQSPLSFEEWKAINHPEPEMAEGGESKPKFVPYPRTFEEYADEALEKFRNLSNQGLNATFPLRKMVGKASSALLDDWQERTIQENPGAYLGKNAKHQSELANFHIKNAIRKKIGMNPVDLPETSIEDYADLSPFPEPKKKPMKKANGGSVNLDAIYMAVNDAKFRRK